jgi:hypothetical protein
MGLEPPRLGRELELEPLPVELLLERPPFELELGQLPSLVQPHHRCLPAWVLPPQVANQSALPPVRGKFVRWELELELELELLPLPLPLPLPLEFLPQEVSLLA